MAKVKLVQCVCGRLKQEGFICDFCYSTHHNGSSSDTPDNGDQRQ